MALGERRTLEPPQLATTCYRKIDRRLSFDVPLYLEIWDPKLGETILHNRKQHVRNSWCNSWESKSADHICEIKLRGFHKPPVGMFDNDNDERDAK